MVRTQSSLGESPQNFRFLFAPHAHLRSAWLTSSPRSFGICRRAKWGKTSVSRRGDVWLFGDHRIGCGDSTSGTDVALGEEERRQLMRRCGFVKFTFSAPVRVVPQAHIVPVSDGQSHVDFPLRLFNLTTPTSESQSRQAQP